MGCCGDHHLPGIPTSRPNESDLHGAGNGVRVAYLGNNSFSVIGTFSGRSYRFSPQTRLQWVDSADSRVLLRTRYFQRA